MPRHLANRLRPFQANHVGDNSRDDDTTFVRIDKNLKQKLSAIVKRWRATRSQYRNLNEAQYVQIHLQGPVEREYAEMVREQHAELVELERRSKVNGRHKSD